MAAFIVGAFLLVTAVCIHGAIQDAALGRILRESMIAGVIGGIFGVALENVMQGPSAASGAALAAGGRVAEAPSVAPTGRGAASDKHKGLRATVQRCTGRATVVRCDLVMTNTRWFKHRFMFRVWDRDVMMWGQGGTVYRPVYMQVSNYAREFGGVRAYVVRGVPTQTLVAFQVAPGTPEVAVLEMMIGVERNGQTIFRFKRIPIQWAASP